jgi:hypothetical protein
MLTTNLNPAPPSAAKKCTIEANLFSAINILRSIVYRQKTKNGNWLRFWLSQPLSECIEVNLRPITSPELPPEPSAQASNSPARSNSTTPAIPHPSASRPDTPTHSRLSSFGRSFPHPDPSY